MVIPFDDAPQGALGIVDARSNGSNGGSGNGGDRVVTHRLDEPQQQGLAMLRRKLIQRRMNLAGIVSGEVFISPVIRQLDVIHCDSRGAASAKLAKGAV